MRSSLFLRPTPSYPSARFVCRQCRRLASQVRAFKEGDMVVVKEIKGRDDREGKMITLKAAQRLENQHGTIPHSDIIGRRPGDVISSHRGKHYRIHEPSLAEYVCMSRRLVTPVYPQDANVIVSQLDLHPTPPSDDETPLEILEVGTGHGSLTLHIARAIHAINGFGRANTDEYTDTRRAVLHTADISAKHSERARQVVQGFRHGLYAPHVDFHVGPLDQVLSKIMEARKMRQEDRRIRNPESAFLPAQASEADSISQSDAECSSSTPSDLVISPDTPPSETEISEHDVPFLAHAIIDTPSSHAHIAHIIKHLLPSGKILIFNPSITQIADCAEVIKKLRLPLDCETVLELGQGISGGREWNVRAVVPRFDERALNGSKETPSEVESESEVEDALSTVEAASPAKKEKEKDFVMICRPKVGSAIIGGGFVGVWRKRGD